MYIAFLILNLEDNSNKLNIFYYLKYKYVHIQILILNITHPLE